MDVMKHTVIDNFLDEEYFDKLKKLCTGTVTRENHILPWYFEPNISTPDVNEDNIFYMTHLLYNSNAPINSFYDYMIPILQKLEVICLIRVKANLYPHTEILHEHPLHIDYKFSHSAAILSLNTCDGYTMLEDGTKIDSVANRILLFDASKKHCSTTTTNESARINININYLQP